MSEVTTTPVAKPRRDFSGERQVHEPHKVGLPPVGPYLKTLWQRRDFAFELSRTNLRAQHFNTVFGQLWLIINPLLLALVYFLLVDILRGGSRGSDFLAHLIAGLFAYYFLNTSLTTAVRSVVSGGRLILNTAFPRVLLPLSSVITAFKRFLPTLPIYAIIHLVVGLPVGIELLWMFPILALMVVLASGLAIIVSAVQVYFRDLKSFLPYGLRMWLYTSPILYFAHEVPARYEWILVINPLAPLLTAWSDVLIFGRAPDGADLGIGAAWSFGLLLAGLFFFMSREREFAVRL
jgi:teichoic acid transport system permease protein